MPFFFFFYRFKCTQKRGVQCVYVSLLLGNSVRKQISQISSAALIYLLSFSTSVWSCLTRGEVFSHRECAVSAHISDWREWRVWNYKHPTANIWKIILGICNLPAQMSPSWLLFPSNVQLCLSIAESWRLQLIGQRDHKGKKKKQSTTALNGENRPVSSDKNTF